MIVVHSLSETKLMIERITHPKPFRMKKQRDNTNKKKNL